MRSVPWVEEQTFISPSAISHGGDRLLFSLLWVFWGIGRRGRSQYIVTKMCYTDRQIAVLEDQLRAIQRQS